MPLTHLPGGRDRPHYVTRCARPSATRIILGVRILGDLTSGLGPAAPGPVERGRWPA